MLPKRNLSQDEVSLEIDLKKLFGKSVNDPAIRRAIAESLIEKILNRTESGQGVDGKGKVVKFPKYSKEYTESLEFAGFNKSKDKINLKLTGSMLSSVDLIAEQSNKIKIGIDNEEAPKAFNHVTGDTLPKRPFLGLTAEDLDSVKKEFAKEVESTEPITAADVFNRDRLSRLVNVVTSRRGIFEVDDE